MDLVPLLVDQKFSFSTLVDCAVARGLRFGMAAAKTYALRKTAAPIPVQHPVMNSPAPASVDTPSTQQAVDFSKMMAMVQDLVQTQKALIDENQQLRSSALGGSVMSHVSGSVSRQGGLAAIDGVNVVTNTSKVESPKQPFPTGAVSGRPTFAGIKDMMAWMELWHQYYRVVKSAGLGASMVNVLTQLSSEVVNAIATAIWKFDNKQSTLTDSMYSLNLDGLANCSIYWWFEMILMACQPKTLRDAVALLESCKIEASDLTTEHTTSLWLRTTDRVVVTAMGRRMEVSYMKDLLESLGQTALAERDYGGWLKVFNEGHYQARAFPPGFQSSLATPQLSFCNRDVQEVTETLKTNCLKRGTDAVSMMTKGPASALFGIHQMDAREVLNLLRHCRQVATVKRDRGGSKGYDGGRDSKGYEGGRDSKAGASFKLLEETGVGDEVPQDEFSDELGDDPQLLPCLAVNQLSPQERHHQEAVTKLKGYGGRPMMCHENGKLVPRAWDAKQDGKCFMWADEAKTKVKLVECRNKSCGGNHYDCNCPKRTSDQRKSMIARLKERFKHMENA